MDDQVERLKKLKAGKERLAAFQKKKTKKKRKSDTGVEEPDSSPQRCPSQAPSPECGSPAGAGAACPPVQPSEDADPPSDQQISEEMTEPSSVHYLNDTGNLTDEVNQSLSESEKHSLFNAARIELRQASGKISELEESVLGKQRALERLGLEIQTVKSENERLKQAAVISNSQMNSYDHLDKCKPGSQRDQVLRIQELENAVVKRDELLRQLSSRLQISVQEAADKGLQQVCSAETQKLAQQVQLLQLQLQQAGEKLNGQMKQHCVSAQALQDAKNEILNLQLVIQQKDEMMSQLVQKLSQVNEDYVQLQSSTAIAEQQMIDHQELLKQLNALKDQSDSLSVDLDEERLKNKQLEKQLKDEHLTLMHNAHDEPIAVEDHIWTDSSSVNLSQPGKESTLIQELNCEKSKNQALDLQLQNQFHLIQKFVSLYHSHDPSGSTREEFDNVLHQLTELIENLSKNDYSSAWSHHLPNSFKPSSFQDFECQVDLRTNDMAENNNTSSWSDNDNVHKLSHTQELEELRRKLQDLQSENQDLSTEMAKSKSSFNTLLATKDELDRQYRAAEEYRTSVAETIQGYVEELQALKEENAGLSASISNLEKSLSAQSEEASRALEAEALLNNELALLKSEKDALNLSFQKKDEDIQVLSEKLELSHQEVMNLKNMKRTLEQELSGSQGEKKQLKEQLDSRMAETDQLRGDEKALAEKLASSQAEVNRLKIEIESVIDESSKHQKTVENEMVKLKEVIADYRQQIAQLEEENSQQVKKALDQENRLLELDQQIVSLTHTAKSAELNNEKLSEEKNACTKKTLSLVQYFSHLQTVLLSLNNPAQQVDTAHQLSADDDPDKFGGIINEVSSVFGKHRERIDQLELENNSLMNACIQEKEDIEKTIKEKSNEIIIYQQTIEQTKQTIEALQSENQKLTDQLQEVMANARKTEAEQERLQAQVDTLQMDDAEREHFKQLDQLLVNREEEIERLKTEMDSFTRNFEKENENQRQVISELNEQISKKEEVEQQTSEELKQQQNQINSLQRVLQDEAEEAQDLRKELSSLRNMKESSSLALQSKETEIQNLQENVTMLKSQNQDQLDEIQTVTKEKDILVSEVEQLKSTCSSLESNFHKEKAKLEKMESEKNKLGSENTSLHEELIEKQKLISNMESHYQSEKEQLNLQNEALSKKLDEMADKNKCLEDRCAHLGGERDQEVSKMDAELSALKVLLKTHNEESSQKLKEAERKLQDAEKQTREWEQKAQQLKSEQFSAKSNFKNQIQKINKEKEQHKAKIAELSALSQQKEEQEGQLKALLESKSSELKQANEELSKLKEQWQVEKTELSSKMSKNQDGHLEEVKKLKAAHTKLSEEKSKLSNSFKELEKKFHSKEMKNEELAKLKELWQVEKTELCSKVEVMSTSQDGHLEEVKKLKEGHAKLSEEKSKLSNSLKELEKKFHSKEKSFSDKNSKLQNTIKELKQKLKDKTLLEENSKLQNSLKDLKQKSADSEKALLEEKSKLQDSIKDLEQKSLEKEKVLSEENAKLKDSVKELNQKLTEVQKGSGSKRGKNSKNKQSSEETASIGSNGGQSEQNDKPLYTKEELTRRLEEIEADLSKKQEDELELLSEKYERDLKYARLDILQELNDEKENYERELDQKYTLKVESLKAETDRSFIKSLQKVRSEMESKHREEMSEQKMSILKECLQMAPHELESRIGNTLHDMQVKNQAGGLLEKYQAKKLAESRDSLLQQIELLNNQYEQIQDEQFSFSERLTKKPVASSPRIRRKFDTLPQDIESASRSLVELSRAKGCYDEEKSCCRLDCQGYRKRYEIALKILTEKGLTSFDNMSEKSSFEVDSLDGSTSVGDQQRDELSQDLQDEYNELMERTMTEPVVSGCFSVKHSPEPQCPSCIILIEEKLSLKKRLSIQLELFGKERFLLQNRCEHLSVELENALLNRDQLQKELTIVKEVQQGRNSSPTEIEFTELKVKLANTEDQVAFLKNKVSQNETDRQELKTKINDLFVKLIDQQHYIDTLEEEYSRSRSAWHHKGTMTCEDHTSVLPVREMEPGLNRRHSDPNTRGQYTLEHIGNLYRPRDNRISKSVGNLSPVDDISFEPAMWLPKISRSRRDTSPDSLNKSPFSDRSSQPEESEFYKNYCPDRTGSSLSDASTLLTADVYMPNTSTPQKLPRATHSSPSLTTLGEFHESDRVFSSDKENHLPFSAKHLELIDEVAELKRSISKTKEQHIQETAILREFIDRLQQSGSTEKLPHDLAERMCDNKNFEESVSLSSDVVDLRQKVSLLRETCRKLTEDNGELMKKLYDQECLVMKTKYYGAKMNAISDSDELDTLFGKQLLLLQKHRDELSLKLREERSLENQITELVAGKSSLEQILCREKEMKEECIYKKGLVDSELASLKAEYERVLQEQLCLEQVIRDKDSAAKELQSKNFKMDQQLSDISGKLKESEKILNDMREKETTNDEKNSETNLTKLQAKFSRELHDAKNTIEKQNIQRLEGLRKEMEEQHAVSVDYLRQQLRSDFKLRESRLEEHHASHIASLHKIHGEQLQNLKDEYEAQMEELKQELHKEWLKNVDSGASSNSSTELNGLSQTEQQKQEAQMLVLDKLRDVLSAPQRQQLETVMQEIKQQHKNELDRVKSQCEDEIDLRVKAARLTVEQVYKSQSELMKASLEEKKQSELAELRDSFARCHNEEISRRETEWNDHLGKLQAQYEYQIEIGQEPAPKGAVGTLEGASLIQSLTTRLNEEHKKLIKAFVGMGKPSLGLKWLAVSSVTEPWMSSFFDIIVTDQDVGHLREVIAKEESQRDLLSGYSSPTQPALHAADSLEFLDTASNASQDGPSSRWAMSMSDDGIHRCLEEQKEEIMLLRSKILKEYEQLLKARTDSMVVGSHGDISRLQDEIEALQQQYEIQIASLKQGMSSDITADSQDTKNLSRCLDTDQRQALSNLVEHFKSKVHSIESRFNNQITGLKFQIESDLSASFGEASCEMDDSFQIGGAPLTSTGRSSTSGQNLLFSKICKETSSGRHSLGNSARLDQDSLDRSYNANQKSDSTEYISLLDKKDTRAFQQEIASLRRQLEDVITSKTFLQREKEELIFNHTKALSGQQENLVHEHKTEIDDLQRQFDIQLQVELKKQAVELLEKYQAENEESHLQNRRKSFEKELVRRTMTAGHFDSYDASDTRNVKDGSNLLSVPCQKYGQNKSPDQIISDYEARIAQMQTDFERRLESLRLELTEVNEAEKQELTSKHQIEVKNLQKQFSDVEEKYESVMEGLRTGAAPEVAQMMRDKYDTELELAKALMQQEFEESLEGEQSRMHEQQEKLVEDFLSKKTSEMRDLQRKYDENLDSLQKMLLLYEQQCSQDVTDGSGGKQMLSVLRQQLMEKDNKMAEEQERHEQEIEKLRGEYEEKIAHLKYAALTPEDHVGQTSPLAKKNIDTIKTELDAAHQAELKLVKEQLNSKHAKMIENLEKQYEMKIEELEIRHKDQLEQLQKESADNDKKSPKKKDVAVQVDLLSPADQTCSPLVSPWSSPSSSAELDRSATPVELMTTRSFADVVKASRKPSSPPATGTTSSSPVDSRSNSLSKSKKSGQTVEHSHSLDSDAGQADLEAGDSARPTDQVVIIEANQNLLRHLSNLVRSYLNIEDTINKKLHQVLSGSKTVAVGAAAAAAAGPSPSDSPTQADHMAVAGNTSKRRKKRFKSADRTPPSTEVSARVNRAKSMDPNDPRYALSQSGTQKNKTRRFRPNISSVDECSSSGDDFHEISITSSVTDEGLVLSQQFSDSIIFTGPTLDTESIELITDTSSRLQNSIMRLLEMMEETTQQLLESKTMQQELLDTLRSKDGDVQNLNQRLQEMSEQLKQEINSREHLALELHKSQGLVEGFSAERDQLSTRLKDLEDREAVLAMENETLRNKIHDLQMSESEVTSLHQEVQRQQTILYDNAGREHQDVAVLTDPVEWSEQQGLLDEICQLNNDKRRMMQLLQQNQDSYEVRIQDLIASGEDLEHKYSEMLDEKRQQIDDLRLQLESVERQLKANKQFLNEQAQDREQEREEFQREINKWKLAMQQVERQQNTETRLKKEVEELSDQLESRISSQSDILMKNEKLERDLQDKELTAQELKKLVSQFEQELDEKNNSEKHLMEKISQLETRLQSLEEVNNELSDELKTSLPKNEEKITQLEHQLEDQELVYRKQAMSLDEELKKAHKLEEELSSEKTALEQQVCDQLLQIASFKNQLDDYRQRSLARDTAESTDGSNPILDELRAQLQRKDEEILQLTDMVDKLELELVRKDNQLGRLEMATFHREPLSAQSSVDEQENSKLLLMKDENQKLRSQVSTLQRQVTTAGFSSLAQQLLDEKNEQIDQLKEQLARQDHYNPSDDAFSEINCLKEELEKKMLEIEEKDAEICSLKHMINSLQHGSANVSGEHFPGDVSLPFNQEPSFLEDSMSERTSLQQELSAVLTDRDKQIDSLKSQLQEKDDFTSKIQMESMLEHQEAIESLQVALQDKDITLDQMYVEVDGLHAEVANLTEHQTKLQEDFDTVQTMLENKEKEIESLTKELSDTRSQNEKSQIDTDVAVRYEVEIGKLKKKMKELENVIDEKMEENYTLNEKVEEMENFKTQMEKMKSDLQEKEKQLANKVSVTQGMEKRIESSNKVIRQLQEREDHWHLKYSQTELQLREREEHLHQLQNELLERDDNEGTVRQRLMVTEQQLSVQQQNIQTLQMQLSERDKRFKEYNETSSELKDTISSLEEEKEQMAVQMSTKDQEIPKLQEQLARLQKIVQDQAADISRREKSYMTLVKMHQEKDEMISMEEGRTLVLRGEVEDLQNELLKKDEELSEALEELQSLKTSSKEQRSEELKEEEDGSSKTDGDSSALQKLVSQQKEEIKQVQSELETLKKLDQQKSERIAQLEAELEERLCEIKTLETCVAEQKHHLMQANTKAETLQEELQDTWKSKLAGESQIDELRQKLFKIESEDLKVYPVSSLDDSQTIQSKFTDLWSEIQKRESDVERLECELSDVHQKLRSQEAEILHTHLQTAQDGGQLSEEINMLLGKLQQLELELEAKNKLISCYEFQLNKKDDVLQDLQVKLDQTMSTYQHNEQEYHTLLGEEQKQASMAEGRIVVLRSEVDDLQKELIHKENELRSVKDHLMETQGQLIDRAQEMTRLCQRRSSSDIQDDIDSNSVQISVKTDKEQENAAAKVTENTVEMLEEELQTMRAQLQARTKQLEEANQNQEVTSVDNTALPHDQLIDHVNQVQDELRITRGVLERLCKANSAQQATLQEREQQVQQLQADLAAMLAQQKAALAAENKTLQKGEVAWPTQSFESPEFHNVGPMVKSPDNRGAQSAAQEVHSPPHPTEQNIQDRLQVLLNRMHREGLQNMSLAELQFIRQYASPKPNPKDIDIQALRAAWEKERQSLLSAIQALKDLLSHEQQITGSQWQSGMSSVDWRSKILQALSHVFAKERDVLLSELHSYVLSSGDGAMELSDIQRLENKIQTQDSQQRAAMEQVVTADRQSLLSELQDCTAKIAIMELQHHEEKHELSEKLTNLERQMTKREEQSQRHIQLLEYRLQQSRIVHDDLQSSLEMERKRAAELAVELTKAKTQSLDMHNECTNLQVNLAKVKDALEQEHSRYLSLMCLWEEMLAALEEEKVKTAELTEQLDLEKGKVHDLEVEVENLNGQMGQERDLEFQHLHLALENEKDKLKEAEDVAREKQAENLHLQQELETERLHSQSLIAKHDADVAHMKSCQKENESYIEQLTSNLNKEKALNIQLKQSLDKVCSIRQDTSERDRASITDLQALLDTERSQLKDLQQQMETLRVDSQTKVMALMSEVQGTREKLEKEKTKFHKLQVKFDIVENQHSDIERQLNYEKERAIRLQAEKHTLALELQNVRQREKERYIAMESEKMANNKKLKEMARFVDNNKVAMHQNELEAQRLQDKVQALETDLQNSRLRERQLVHEMEYSKLRSPLHLENIAAQARLQQQDEESPKSDSSKREKMLSAYKSQLENVRQHLEFNGIKIQDLLNKSLTYVKSSHNAQSSEAFATLRPLVTTIGELLSDLRQLQISLTLEKEGPGYPHLSAMVNQRTLQHNRELINSIFALSEEKLSLREQLLKMEERICDYKNREVVQQSQPVDEQGMSLIETSFSVERMKWEQERTSYELALQNAEKKIEQLQRNLRIERSQGLAASGTNPWVADKELVQSLYQKYLRAESFRKALIYQKNYLLVLLGGFQDSEQTVLALLAQMGATDSNSPLRGGEPRRPGRLNCRRPLTMFRSVARAAIAICRMKFLVRKLQQLCATPLPAALMLGPPALTQQRSGYTASESSSTSSTTSSSSRLTSNKIPSPQDTSPRLTLNHSVVMQGGARARSPPNSNPTSTGRLLPVPGLTPTRNQFLTTHGLKNSRGSHAFNAIPQTDEENGTSLETPNSNSAMMNPKQLRFMTPPTKEISHRGSLQRVPAIQQLCFDHSNPSGQRTHNDYSPTSSSEGALIANPCPSNGDIPNNENSDEPHVENSTTQDDFLHCIERVQNRVDQLRHPPQIERQRHRRKYDGFHKNVDL